MTARLQRCGVSPPPIAGASSPNDHYLELDRNEKDMIAEAKANFDKVIVILNVGTTMELDELAGDEGIDAIIRSKAVIKFCKNTCL